MTKTLFASFFRDWQTLFFSLVLPLIFLIIFGFLYQTEGEEGRITNAVVYEEAQTENDLFWEVLDSTPGLRYQVVDSAEDVSESLRTNTSDMGLIWDGQVLKLFTNPVRIQDNHYFEQLARSIKGSIDQQLAGIIPLLETHSQTIDADLEDETPSGLLFMLPGIIALGAASSGLFAISASFMHYKDKKVLKRLMATSMRKMNFMAGLMTTRVAASILSALLTLFVGQMLFDVHLTIDWVLFLPYVIVSTVIMMGVGCIIILVVKTSENAMQVSSILITIMIFFSGIYFPVEFLPPYLQNASTFLPLTYMARGFRFIMGVEQLSHSRLFIETLVLLILSLALTWVVTIRSQWTD